MLLNGESSFHLLYLIKAHLMCTWPAMRKNTGHSVQPLVSQGGTHEPMINGINTEAKAKLTELNQGLKAESKLLGASQLRGPPQIVGFLLAAFQLPPKRWSTILRNLQMGASGHPAISKNMALVSVIQRESAGKSLLPTCHENPQLAGCPSFSHHLPLACLAQRQERK